MSEFIFFLFPQISFQVAILLYLHFISFTHFSPFPFTWVVLFGNDRTRQRYVYPCIEGVWKPRNSQLGGHAKRVSGPGIVIEFSGSKSRLLYEKLHTSTYRQVTQASTNKRATRRQNRAQTTGSFLNKSAQLFRKFSPPYVVSPPTSRWRNLRIRHH